MRVRRVFDWLLPALGGALVFFLGDWTVALRALAVFVVMDVATGWLRAYVQGVLSSKESWRGVAKKVGIFLLVGVAHQAGLVLAFEGLRDLVIGFLCMTEGLSILENLVAAGVPSPEWLRDVLEEARQSKFRPR